MFLVDEAPEGSHVARAVGESILTEADDLGRERTALLRRHNVDHVRASAEGLRGPVGTAIVGHPEPVHLRKPGPERSGCEAKYGHPVV